MKESRRDFADARLIDVWFDVRHGKEKGQALSDPPSRIGDTNVLLLSRQFREDCAQQMNASPKMIVNAVVFMSFVFVSLDFIPRGPGVR